ncbi:hypothetical protein B0H19DRAFT_1069642 [Mycena capillaripes]|nr:hypothetical protein B0H19DRAFT_1069642 [Mycena capillaripes]
MLRTGTFLILLVTLALAVAHPIPALSPAKIARCLLAVSGGGDGNYVDPAALPNVKTILEIGAWALNASELSIYLQHELASLGRPLRAGIGAVERAERNTVDVGKFEVLMVSYTATTPAGS